MTAVELKAVGVSYKDNGRWTTPGGAWTASASGLYGEFAGMQVVFSDFMLMTTDESGNFNDKFFFNAFGDMAPGWYYTRFIIKDAHSWTIHDITGTWYNEALYADGLVFDPQNLMSVTVDIKPGSCSNKFNVKKKKVLTFAILGTEELDVSDIDPQSVRLQGVKPLQWNWKDVATSAGKEEIYDCVDSGPDGFLDLTFKVKILDLVEVMGEVEDGQTVPLRMTGELSNRTPIDGEDVVFILKKEHKGRKKLRGPRAKSAYSKN
jgi:hypothetical protein